MNTADFKIPLGRRAFLQGGSLVLAAAAIDSTALNWLAADDSSESKMRVGLVTDLHYADKPPAGSRHYRETLTKLSEAAQRFAEEKPQFAVELGDLIDYQEIAGRKSPASTIARWLRWSKDPARRATGIRCWRFRRTARSG